MLKNNPSNWDALYQCIQTDELTWHEPLPLNSVKLITLLNLPKDASIIDVGAGGSMLVNYLLALGFRNITVADFSVEGLMRAKMQLGNLASQVKWIHANILELTGISQYDLWHDRATLQFFNDSKEQITYVKTAYKALKPNGHVILGQFAKEAPELCHEFIVQKFSENKFDKLFRSLFKKTDTIYHKHITPANGLLPFIYCSFRKSDFL